MKKKGIDQKLNTMSFPILPSAGLGNLQCLSFSQADRNGGCMEDPRLQISGMTVNLNKIPLIRTSSTFPLMGEAPSTWRERAECVSTGVKGKIDRGFSLIELLVVVLIIGILATVALPQYQFAIVKAKTSSMLPLIKSMSSAEENYFLTHGTYTNDAGELDYTMPNFCRNVVTGQQWQCGDFLVDFSIEAWQEIILSYCPGYNTDYNNCRYKRDFLITWNLSNHTTPNTWTCKVQNSSSLGTKLCANLSTILKSS